MSTQRKKRVTTPAGTGLIILPSTVDDWQSEVNRLGLQNAKLSDLCMKGPFSASTTPAASFLCVRVLWNFKDNDADVSYTNGIKHLERTQMYFKPEEFKKATRLMESRDYKPFQMLRQYVNAMCETGSYQTPPTDKKSLALVLGPFAQLVHPHGKFIKKGLAVAAPREVVFSGEAAPIAQKTLAIGKFSQYDPVKNSPTFNRGDNMSDISDSFSSMELDEPQATAEDEESGEEGDDDVDDDDREDDIPAPPTWTRRTPTENVIAMYLANLVSAVSSILQSFSNAPVCQADVDEFPFQFGPIQVPQSSSRTTSTVPCFSARIDGGLERNGMIGGDRYLAIFEIKRVLATKQAQLAVNVQQAMEHAAAIYTKHKQYYAGMENSDKKTYYNLMITQSDMEVRFSIAEYSKDYLDYIFGDGSQGIVPPTTAKDPGPFLRIYEYGSLNIHLETDMNRFLHLLIVLIIAERRVEGPKDEDMF